MSIKLLQFLICNLIKMFTQFCGVHMHIIIQFFNGSQTFQEKFRGRLFYVIEKLLVGITFC